MAALADGAATAAGWGDGAARFTRFRGDGWQASRPRPPSRCARSALLRARLRMEGRAFDTRVAIGIGAAELPAAGDLAAASGPAFRIAGHGLDTMAAAPALPSAGRTRPPTRARLRRSSPCSTRSPALDAVPGGGSSSPALPPAGPTQAEVAAALGISQQMVAQHLRAGSDPGRRDRARRAGGRRERDDRSSEAVSAFTTFARLLSEITTARTLSARRMLETAVALGFAHVVADFVLQTDAMVANKHRPLVLLAHIAIVAATAWLALGLPVGPVAPWMVAPSPMAPWLTAPSGRSR
jgi:hypothetical protein